MKIQTKYFERENLRTIEEKNQILLLREEALARQRMLIFAISTAVALSFILIYFILRSARQQSIAKRKLAEAMIVIESHNRNLTTTVKEKTNDLRLSNMELRKSYGEYDHLIYRASHDIRGPLTTLLGLTNLAKQEQDDPAKVKDYLAKIESTTEGLSAMLSQLTDINRIRNQPVCIESIDVGALAEEVFRSFNQLDHFPLISLRLQQGEWKEGLRTDRALLYMILAHLIHNSFKYFSPHRQEKYIKVSWKQKEGRTFISVEDNGQGIDEKAGVKVFQLFYVASDSHGMGLGLFMAQLAARRLGGRIKLRRSKEPTTFQLILPNRPKEMEFTLLDEDERLALMIKGQDVMAALSSP
ncbi:MAG: HAMP domain-containing histidine kinase [Cyclobacteriaceae bacterium]|nr:HAMP domain-containing histidine kinase [Cyclobacteriaceae bacterium]